jgi:hypothetical protein
MVNTDVYLKEIRNSWIYGRATSSSLIVQIQRELGVNEQVASDIFFNAIDEYTDE